MLSLELLSGSGSGFIHCRDHFSSSFFLLTFFILTIIWDGRISDVLQGPIAPCTQHRKWRRGGGKRSRKREATPDLLVRPCSHYKLCLWSDSLRVPLKAQVNSHKRYSKLVRNWILMFCQPQGTIWLTNKCTLQSNWILTSCQLHRTIKLTNKCTLQSNWILTSCQLHGTIKLSNKCTLQSNWILTSCQLHGTIKLTNKCTLQSNWILTSCQLHGTIKLTNKCTLQSRFFLTSSQLHGMIKLTNKCVPQNSSHM